MDVSFEPEAFPTLAPQHFASHYAEQGRLECPIRLAFEAAVSALTDWLHDGFTRPLPTAVARPGVLSLPVMDENQVLYNPRKFGLDAPFDVITVTPPYEEVVYAELVKALCVSDVRRYTDRESWGGCIPQRGRGWRSDGLS